MDQTPVSGIIDGCTVKAHRTLPQRCTSWHGEKDCQLLRGLLTVSGWLGLLTVSGWLV
jgi:hypothetical protein